MNRDEILQRSRAEKEDEGNTFLENRGRRFGVVGFCAMYILLVVFNFATGQSSYALHALFWGYTALDAWGKYRPSRRKVFLTTAVMAGFASLCFLTCHVLEVLRCERSPFTRWPALCCWRSGPPLPWPAPGQHLSQWSGSAHCAP